MIEPWRIRLQRLVHFSGESIYTDVNLESNPRYIQICDQSAIRLMNDVLKVVGVMILCSIIYSFNPMYALVYLHEIFLPYPVFFPFTDSTTMHGIIINMANQLFLGLIGIAGNLGIEVMTCMIKNTVWVAATAICYSIDELTDSVKQSKPSRIIDMEFRKMLIQVQDLDR